MKLSTIQIAKITTGAESVEEKDALTVFHRFTSCQEELYRIEDDFLFSHAPATAGIRLSFETDSEKLFLGGSVCIASKRSYYSIDVFADGKMIGCVDNFSDCDLSGKYVENEFSLDDFSKEFSLGKGKKAVSIYLPWSVGVSFRDVILDDNSFVKPIKKDKTILAFGDSITQGYDVLRPSNRYMSLLANKLEADEHNKAIGGALFFPELAGTEATFVPDYIIVAYGTNDWDTWTREEFERRCEGFLAGVSQKYPTSKIFAVSPIFRPGPQDGRKFGHFDDVGKCIEKASSGLENVTFILGSDLVPKSEEYFADIVLHPNDEGAKHQFNNLYKSIERYL